MGFLDWFRNNNIVRKFTRWREFGSYNSVFTSFGSDMYKSDVVRSCIRPLAEHSSKANVVCSDKRLERILTNQPNMFMNGKDFLSKIRITLELKNTAFIYIYRDSKNGKATGFYPVPYDTFEALEYNNGLFIRFRFAGSPQVLVAPWEDVAVLRKDYNESDIAGDDNTALLKQLELLNTANEGIAHAVKATANLRGLLKNTKAMLATDQIKEARDQFVRDYMSLENSGGIASLDSTQEFIPINMNPTIASVDQMVEYRESVQRYFGVSDAIIKSDFTESQMEAFYSARIEPFLVALSQELTRKVFTERELGFDNFIVFESNKLQFASFDTKVKIFKEVVLYGGMLINEWRKGCNMAPLPGGDVRIMRLDARAVDDNGDFINEEEDKNGD